MAGAHHLDGDQPGQRSTCEPDPDQGLVGATRFDLTLADRTGQELDMGTPYDFFGPEAHPSYQALPDSVLANRRLLRETMIRYGFKPIRTEWWHYSFGGKNYMLSDMLWKCY